MKKAKLDEVKTSLCWTSKGKHIPYGKLTDMHLKNIINDGYRNANLVIEAHKRKMKVPDRLVDKLTVLEIFIYVESFNSVALSGNELGIKMSKLWDNDQEMFKLILNKIMEDRNKKKLPK